MVCGAHCGFAFGSQAQFVAKRSLAVVCCFSATLGLCWCDFRGDSLSRCRLAPDVARVCCICELGLQLPFPQSVQVQSNVHCLPVSVVFRVLARLQSDQIALQPWTSDLAEV